MVQGTLFGLRRWNYESKSCQSITSIREGSNEAIHESNINLLPLHRASFFFASNRAASSAAGAGFAALSDTRSKYDKPELSDMFNNFFVQSNCRLVAACERKSVPNFEKQCYASLPHLLRA